MRRPIALNAKNRRKGTYRMANTMAAARDSIPMNFAKSIFVDDIFGRWLETWGRKVDFSFHAAAFKRMNARTEQA
jgi:hypothetical protein